MDITQLSNDGIKQIQAAYFFIACFAFAMCAWKKQVVGSIVMVFAIGIPGIFVLFPKEMSGVAQWLLGKIF